jgi:hypothetical protein
VTDLAAWLLARIAEDEAAARAAADEIAHLAEMWDEDDSDRWGWVEWSKPGASITRQGPVADQVARWDPARVLAECDAKRRIVVSCQGMQTAVVPMAAYLATVTLRSLALPYADAPGWREEWRP